MSTAVVVLKPVLQRYASSIITVFSGMSLQNQQQRQLAWRYNSEILEDQYALPSRTNKKYRYMSTDAVGPIATWGLHYSVIYNLGCH
jgi:hypothetical protein